MAWGDRTFQCCEPFTYLILRKNTLFHRIFQIYTEILRKE